MPGVLDDAAPPNVYTLRGTRRIGKSTLLKQTVRRLITQGIDPRRICYFAADALDSKQQLIDLFQVARTFFPDLNQQRTSRYFLIDEVSGVPDWSTGLKWLRDNEPVIDDCVIATGSSAKDLRQGASGLVGRSGEELGVHRLLLPMSFPEFVQHAGFGLAAPVPIPYKDFFEDAGRTACQDALVHLNVLVDAFEQYLAIGGFPRAVADFRRQGSIGAAFYRDVWDVIETDLRQLGVRQSESVMRLLERIARHLTSYFEYNEVANDLGVDRDSVIKWIDALADGYLVFRLLQQEGGLPAPNKQRKVYPIDPLIAHMAAHLSGTPSPEVSQLAESALAVALLRAIEGDRVDAFAQPGRLFLFRTEKSEVDFVQLPDFPTEAKYSDALTRASAVTMIRNFQRGLLLSRADADIKPPVPIIPSAVFAWLLDQKG